MARTKPFLKWTRFVEVRTDSTEGKCFQNSRYMVIVRKFRHEYFGDGLHLSIKRNDREAIHDWRDLQRIKNELLGSEIEALELYPAETRLVDGANQYHLWAFPDFTFEFGFQERLVVLPENSPKNVKQRPFEHPVSETTIPDIP